MCDLSLCLDQTVKRFQFSGLVLFAASAFGALLCVLPDPQSAITLCVIRVWIVKTPVITRVRLFFTLSTVIYLAFVIRFFIWYLKSDC